MSSVQFTLCPFSLAEAKVRRLIFTFVLVTLAAATPAAAGPAVSFSFGPIATCGPNNVEGWEFQTTAPLTVSALGVYDHLSDGLGFSTPVGLYDASCTLLASTTIPAGTGAPLLNRFRYVGITPIALPSGATFRVAAVIHCDDFTPQVNSLASVSVDPGLTAVQTKRIAFGSSLACPTEGSSIFLFSPNFLIGPACGNGVVQGNEECDDGNTADGDCCSSTCQYEPDGSPCEADENVCTADVCDAMGACTHAAGNAGAICRPDAGACDVAEQCDGNTSTCPADDSEPDGDPCTDDGLFCSGEETCQGGTCISSGDPCTIGTCDEIKDECVLPSPTASTTPTPSSTTTVTRAPTITATTSPTATATRTATATPSVTPTRTNTRTATIPPTGTASFTPSASATRTSVPTETNRPTITISPTAIVSPTPSASAILTSQVTATNTPTATVPPTAIGTPTASASPTITSHPTATDTPATAGCAGDCDGSGTVAINELILGVNIALERALLSMCLQLDTNDNQLVEINELIAAVNNALKGCPRQAGAGLMSDEGRRN